MKTGYVYILSNKNRTTLYIGVTGNIQQRIMEQTCGTGCSFSSRYNLTDLMLYESFSTMQNAINREKQLKNWHKEWKWNLIKSENPMLEDLAKDWYSVSEIEAVKRG